MNIVAVDLGGTNLRAAMYDLSAVVGDAVPVPVKEHREQLGDDFDPARVATRIAGLVQTVSGQGSQSVVGVAVAGMLRGTTGIVANAPNLGWRDVPFRDLLAARLGRETLLVNDVNAIAYGEYAFGAGRGVRDVLCVFAGTGVGGGFVAAGQLVEGGSNAAGEIGHTKVSLAPDAPPCACGSRGCVEAYAGGRTLMERIQRDLRAKIPDAARVGTLAGSIDAAHAGHLDQAAAQGDPYAIAILDEVTPLLGMVIANAVTLLNPSRLVLGGGMWTRSPEFARRVRSAYERCVGGPAGEACAVVATALGDDAGLLGAAALVASRR